MLFSGSEDMGCIRLCIFPTMMSHVNGMLQSNYCRYGVMFVGMISIQRLLSIVVRQEAYLRCTSIHEVRMECNSEFNLKI